MILLVVAVFTALCFLPSLSGSFLNWDDDVNFLGNPDYRGLGPKEIRWAFTSVLFGHYIPLTRLTFSLNYVLGGMNPWGYHLVNVLLHAGNAVFFYVVARRLLAAARAAGNQDGRTDVDISMAAAVAALVFGVHPLRVESVAWITGRADVLCATFVLLSTGAYLRAVDRPGAARWRLILVSAAAFAAALLSKGVSLPLPIALLLLDLYPLRRLSRLGWWTLVREKIPLFVLMPVAALIMVYAVRHGSVLTGTADYGVVSRVTVTAYSFVVPVVRFVWPAALSPVYEMPARVSPLEPRFGLALGAAILVTAVLIGLRRHWPAGLAAWTFSCLMLLPTSATVRKTSDLAPDRYSYLAGLGFAVLIGGAVLGLVRLVRRRALARPVAWIAAIGGASALAGLGTTSWTFSQIWRDSETLWRWAVELDPACSVCHGKLGESVYNQPAGSLRVAEAESLFRRSIVLRPDQRHAHFNLGNVLVVQGRYAEAETSLRRYMELDPQAALGPERLGRLYLLQNRYEEAIPLLRAAIIRKSDTPGLNGYLDQALQGRARELQANGRGAEAKAFLAEARALGHIGSPLSEPSRAVRP